MQTHSIKPKGSVGLAYLAALAVVLALTGCAGIVPLQRGQISAVTQDTSPGQLDGILSHATVMHQFTSQAKGMQYLTRSYKLQTGIRSEMRVFCSTNCMAIPVSVPVFTPYVVIQALPEKSLFAWGTLEELSKDENPNISDLMPQIKQQLFDLEKKK